jgi:hypothetical protein
LLCAPAFAKDRCWTVGDFKEVIDPDLHDTDLYGPAYIQFMRWSGLSVPQSDEIYIIEDGIKGTAASVYLIFFQEGCAVGKGTLPAEIWFEWVKTGKQS